LEFTASNECFDKFCKCNNFHSIKFTGESSSANHVSVNHLIIRAEGYSSKVVYNADETGLYWKRMPYKNLFLRTLFLITLLFLEMQKKILNVIYKSENPRIFKNVNKANLSIYWMFNYRAWITGKMWFLSFLRFNNCHFWNFVTPVSSDFTINLDSVRCPIWFGCSLEFLL